MAVSQSVVKGLAINFKFQRYRGLFIQLVGAEVYCRLTD